MVTGQLRISILNAPDGLTPLKLRGWFRTEAEDIQATAKSDSDLIIIRLFLPESLLMQATQKHIDKLIQGVVDRHPNIHRVELHPVNKSLTFEEMLEESEIARADIGDLIETMSNLSDETPPTLH